MKNIIYITGHRNPDTDSICSAIAYAELKKKLGFNTIPVRLGDINRETEFVLDYFNVKIPLYLSNVKTQVSDLNIDIVNPASANISIRTAWMLMRKNNIKTLPIVDENERFLGIVTLSDITNKYMDTLENNIIASSKTPLHNIVETLNAKLAYGNQADFKTTGKVVIAAATPEEMEPFIEEGSIVITANRSDIQYKAVEYGANCIIITCGGEVDEDVLEIAQKNKCIIMVTLLDTFTAARLINQSIPVHFIMSQENIISFNADDFLDDIKEKMLQTRFRNYPVVDDRNKLKGLISRYHFISQRKKKVILVDHNEKSQTINGVEEAEILEIIDHHRVGDIQTGNPIYFKNEPVGSTATIIANIYFENGISPSKSIAGILCAAILSDTIQFKSPTSTYMDQITAERLSEMAGIDMDEFTFAMFKAGSSLQGKTPKEIFNQDFKAYNLGKYKIGISQIHTMDMESLQEIKQPLIDYMSDVCDEQHYNLLILLVTDILNEGSEFLYVGKNKGLIEKAFNVKLGENSVYISGIVSRKKQVVPFISLAAE